MILNHLVELDHAQTVCALISRIFQLNCYCSCKKHVWSWEVNENWFVLSMTFICVLQRRHTLTSPILGGSIYWWFCDKYLSATWRWWYELFFYICCHAFSCIIKIEIILTLKIFQPSYNHSWSCWNTIFLMDEEYMWWGPLVWRHKLELVIYEATLLDRNNK